MKKAGCWLLVAMLVVASIPVGPANGCSLCDSKAFSSPTLRQEAAYPSAKIMLLGEITNSRTTGGTAGETDFLIKKVLRKHPLIRDKSKLVLPRYLPINDPKHPPQYLLFCDVDGEKLDPYRGILLVQKDSPEYVEQALSMTQRDPAQQLEFYFRYLDHADPEISRDAFFEFAKARDQDILKAGKAFSADKVRSWVKDPATPAQKLGLYALLLGICGKDEDVDYLKSLLRSGEERHVQAADGILAGFMQQKPREGWDFLISTLKDDKQSLLLRLAMIRAVRFNFNADPKKNRKHLVDAMEVLLRQGDMADIAIEDLRNLGVWDHSRLILSLFGKEGYKSPLVKRSIIRYALSAETSPEIQAFLAQRKQQDADDYQDVVDGLKLERANKN
ncbi:MAG: hypothetical protein ACKO23_14005 [Gemmataceae bacterium]